MGWGTQFIGFSQALDMMQDLQATVGDGVTYIVGTNAVYALYVEFGTSKMKAQPYIRPAVQEFNRNPMSYIQQHQPGAMGSIEDTETLVRVAALALERDIAERAPVDVGNLQASIASAPKGEFDAAAEQAIEEAPNPSALRGND